MDKYKIAEKAITYQGIYEILMEMNEEIERLKKFAKNVNTFGTKIYPEIVHISEDRK